MHHSSWDAGAYGLRKQQIIARRFTDFTYTKRQYNSTNIEPTHKEWMRRDGLLIPESKARDAIQQLSAPPAGLWLVSRFLPLLSSASCNQEIAISLPRKAVPIVRRRM
ncbi:hypothetical protein [Cohnella sp. WQ 127256]|uniref:hypothetical protein n=1 Tax=Cohnella sp. WQ 127256 TaxID=2938790 RepID=UPI0021193FF2|nr:hypothetical protein [Cohnella sp. WQ 127256]